MAEARSGEVTMLAEDIWSQAAEILAGQMTKNTYHAHIAPLKPQKFEAGILTLSCLPISQEWLANRLKAPILAALKAIEPTIADAVFEVQGTIYHPIDEPDEPELGEPDAEFAGIYHDQRNALIQPDRVELHSQYFRRKWRPRLGPLLSELVRELRQRCHHKSGRNTFKTTYKSLALALGVSERTIKRALDRDEAGQFKNEYLNYFIHDMTLLQYRDEQTGQIRTTGTRFVIYLDEPLTPDDEANSPKGQNDTSVNVPKGQNDTSCRRDKMALLLI
jgi:hypothetical protein